MQNPQGETHYVACAFPSACGKTNLAMLIPPESHARAGRSGRVGDDIAWMHPGSGRGSCVRSIPRPATSASCPARTRRPTATPTKRSSRTRFSPTSRSPPTTSPGGKEWQRQADDRLARPSVRRHERPGRASELALHRVGEAESGVFEARRGARGRADLGDRVRRPTARARAARLSRRRDWAHGVLVGASVASETTAAATGKVGVVRRDPMAMKPFCGYNFGDYWRTG